MRCLGEAWAQKIDIDVKDGGSRTAVGFIVGGAQAICKAAIRLLCLQ